MQEHERERDKVDLTASLEVLMIAHVMKAIFHVLPGALVFFLHLFWGILVLQLTDQSGFSWSQLSSNPRQRYIFLKNQPVCLENLQSQWVSLMDGLPGGDRWFGRTSSSTTGRAQNWKQGDTESLGTANPTWSSISEVLPVGIQHTAWPNHGQTFHVAEYLHPPTAFLGILRSLTPPDWWFLGCQSLLWVIKLLTLHH